MSGFTFEKDLPHQEAGISAVMSLFLGAEPELSLDPVTQLLANPELNISDPQYYANIKAVQDYNNIEHSKEYYDCSNIIDVSMETGTGKTFTYTKTMYDLNKSFGVNKFIVIVPTLSIKAGTVNFLKSDALKDHFRKTKREIKTYVVESKKGSNKNKKAYMPQSIHDFVNANSVNQKYIHVLIINSGMINSDSLQKDKYDTGLFNNQFDCPVDALQAVKPIIIVDEPHKFPTAKKTWENIERINAQYIIRYGATFNEYKNLVYRLTAVDAFNDDLVKGINAYIEDVVGDDSANLKLKSIKEKEAFFELNESGNKQRFSFIKGESLVKAHSEIHDLIIDGISKTSVALSNGIQLKVGESLNPYSYAETLEDNMMRKAIKEHFNLERELLTQKPRIKPLSLFFIDDIEGYRDGNDLSGSLKKKFEEWIIAEAEECLKTETNEFYREYLEKTIKDVSLVHGGYFSKDNSDKDDKIEQEINEILHDKELLLSLDNPRRFIFSKWTLREGWDNPNVFQICKLRSSGSTTSKLQEVGRGLRLPVNEYMARVKDKVFSLNYYVDFTEKDFVNTLITEVNESSFKETIPTKLTQEIKDKIHSEYPDKSALKLMMDLVSKDIIDENENFIGSDGYQRLKAEYPKAFPTGVKANKIKKADGAKKRTPMRVGKYQELKSLWEIINNKAVLEYKIEDENQFLDLFKQYLNKEASSFKKTGVRTRIEQVYIHNEIAMSRDVYKEDDDFAKFSTMDYREFLERLSQLAFIKISTLHKAFVEMKDNIDITEYLNIQTIRKIKSGFSLFLLSNAFNKFQLDYKVISNTVHPSKFTNDRGEPLKDVLSSDLGVKSDDEVLPHKSYLFEDVFYDSDLERKNIIDEIEHVTVFTKIPKNSIKIPVAGGFTYSPDFAYVVKTKTNQILNFVVETKNVDRPDSLREEETRKIKHAQALFNKINEKVQVNFETQFANDLVKDLIQKHL
ncbi:type III restriction-modification system endonuclease [Thalassotalea sp. PLHSN55]|uniref:type III restriction-modification system endonuclease n=1 Tax=Thalassotalea sp. PLHSN55 TaxID=3435888 RepID=UPI003F827E27